MALDLNIGKTFGELTVLSYVGKKDGLAPCLNCGQHAGVEPKIMEIVYDEKSSDRAG